MRRTDVSHEHDANDHAEAPRHDSDTGCAPSQHEPRFAQQWHRCWGYVTDVGATLWVLRAPVAALVAGYVILWFMPQAQDLLVDLTSAGWQGLVVFLALVTFVWAMPTEYAATILLETDERYCARIKPGKPAEPAPAPASEPAAVTDGLRGQFRASLQTWMPATLGGLVFLCMLGAAFRSHQNVPTIGLDHYTEQIKEKLTIIELLLVLCFLGFWCYVIARPTIAKRPAVKWAERMARRLLMPVRQHLPPIFAFKHGFEGCDKFQIKSDLGPVLLILVSIFFLVLPMAFPLPFASWFPRASVVPFVIGAWIPLLSFLSGLGRRLHFPIITTCLVVKTLLPLPLSPNYEIEVVSPDKRSANAGINLNEAVRLWKKANQCEKDSAVPPLSVKPCPRPIIVAAAGGASRAGFFTASVLGELLDYETQGEWGGQRLFALSTVSGSSVAGVMTVAAMGASEKRTSPCRSDAGRLWFGSGLSPDGEITSWRDCLESLMSGDFLTPVFVGLMFHDSVRFLRLADRGALLEKSFAQHFADTLKHDEPADCARRPDLKCPFMSLQPSESRWLPLLVLNGTSVGSGQRIVTTVLKNIYQPTEHCPYPTQDGRCHIFVSAFRFHDLLQNGEKRPSADEAQVSRPRDVSLTTAAHNSARFPFISPPGEIYGADNQVVDRLVDGGYFENFGAQTATELAEAIIAIDPKLKPFILVLSNDPTVPQAENLNQDEVKKDFGVTERAGEGAWITDLTGPLKAFMHTRNARGMLAVETMPSALARARAHETSCNVVQLRVWYERTSALEARAISMSWWLSRPVQLYLHEQANFVGKATGTADNKQKTVSFEPDRFSPIQNQDRLSVDNLFRALNEQSSTEEHIRGKALSQVSVGSRSQMPGCARGIGPTSAQR
jgi:hypothetical protein